MPETPKPASDGGICTGNALEFDEEDEGWMWLPWEDLQRLQKEKNRMMNELLDMVALQRRKP
jgi:hypothetical protein